MTIKLTEEEMSAIVQALKLAILLVHEMESNVPVDRWQALADRFERKTQDTPPP